MVTRADATKQDLIDRVARLAQDRNGTASWSPESGCSRADMVERFARQFYLDAPPDDLADKDPDQLYGAVASLLGFARSRTPNTPKLRVFCPRVEEHGWRSDHTVIEIVNDDMPFLVDSVSAALTQMDAQVMMVIHPVLQVRRDKDGTLQELFDRDIELAPDEDGARFESVMQIEINETADDARCLALQKDIEGVLADTRAAVEDWGLIQDKVDHCLLAIDQTPSGFAVEGGDEVKEFLTWLKDNHFTFLGYRNHSFDAMEDHPDLWTVTASDGLGVLRDPNRLVFDELRNLSGLPSEVTTFLSQPTFLLITKANKRSRVHRAVHMDVIGIKRFDAEGRVIGLDMVVGLFTSNVYNNSARFVPVLRSKIERMVERAGFRRHSHDGKGLLNILENLPRDELFQASDDKLLETAISVLHLQERQRTALLVRQDEFERFVSCLVYVPRDRYDTTLRLAIKAILEDAFDGELSAYYTQVADSPLARLHFMIRTQPGKLPPYDVATIEARIALAARAWTDHLKDAILATKGEDQGVRLVRRYGDAFPSFYREAVSPQAAVFDIDRMEEALNGINDTGLGRGSLSMNLYRPLEAGTDVVNFKVYHPTQAVPLSDILPMLEHMGFLVVGEVPSEVHPHAARGTGTDTVWIHDFTMRAADVGEVDVAAIRSAFQDAFAKVWTGEAENDGFNRLVVAAGISWRDVVVLRAYAKYLRQAAFTFSQSSIESALAAHPDIARTLIRLFHARFDPDRAGGDPETFLQRITTALDAVTNPDEDRILRRYLNLIESTLRTNFYQKDAKGQPKSYLSFKIDSQKIEGLPLPRPMVEVWVYSPRVEAIHLRGGKVARGGIRWSDRREDFRTEILGLIKAQMVKNAVIVPVGSKGGFVVKNPPTSGGREAFMAEGIECYKTLMRGLLDVTDNLKAGEVVPPPQVVRRDDDDPYLVVAADKGTATFSDIANGISQDYGFWLDDAFASGGSQGYDHKAMGITARGAWEAVKRHFRERGLNTQAEDFTVVGVGDMSGDVFGNGMLLSEHIKLVGAFNHMHIFIDPDPDPATSFAERQRLFTLPRSSWADYEQSLISKGGGIFERSAKRISLTPEIKALFGLEGDSITPSDLMQAMLKAEVDLLWFGGIGTYIKASSEADSQVGDRANDAIRITGRDVRAHVVGEGANLGVTQRGRIEYATHGCGGKGGRINSDAIDNSAGVDCSDHEVNIKILLNGIVADGDMTLKQRNSLLVEMTDDVARQVLRDNYLQTQAISLMQAQGGSLLDHQARLMRMLEKAGRLNRAIEYLPDDEEISARLKAKEGLTRPEISVLIAYSKIWLFDEILESDLPDDPVVIDDLVRYFPPALQDRFRDQIGSHKLRREIIATHATNSMINRVGGTFVTQIVEKTGMPPSDIARAYLVARDAFGLRDLWHAVEALDTKVDASIQYDMLQEANRLIERGTLWILRHAGRPIDMGGLTSALADGRAALSGCLEGVCPVDLHQAIVQRAEHYQNHGAPEDLANRVAEMIMLASTPDMVRVAQDLSVPVPQAANAFFAVGSRFALGWLRASAEALAQTGSHWEKLAIAAVIDELYTDQRAITTAVLRTLLDSDQADPENVDSMAAIEAWADGRRPAVERAEQLVNELRSASTIDLAMLTVASRQFGALKDA
jgi:glutamate dehydrogenase